MKEPVNWQAATLIRRLSRTSTNAAVKKQASDWLKQKHLARKKP